MAGNDSTPPGKAPQMPDKQQTCEVAVNPGGRAYKITIGPGVSKKVSSPIGTISTDCRVLLVTDSNVAPLYLNAAVKASAGKGVEVHPQIIPAGEKHKNLRTYTKLIARLAELDGARDLAVIALGGGVIGDLAGFAAATYRRGIPIVQVPTTLLACVDSSVGGKTGVDLPQGKNLVGAFHQPAGVLIDTDFLHTLPPRELRSGLAEVIKYGFIIDKDFARRAAENIDTLLSLDPVEISYAIRRCCEMKAEVVAADERDTKDIRATLNFGHTFAHAVEAACGYRRYRHGEAVGVGMICAADLSARIGVLSTKAAAFVEKTVASAGLPTTISGASPSALLDFMQKDKKTKSGRLRFILLSRIGRSSVHSDIPRTDILAVLRKRCV